MTPIIYNLFPRLAGPTTRWAEHAERAAALGFDWLYLNPWELPGFSGSLYAIKDYRRLNPAFVPPGADPESLAPLREALAAMRAAGVRPMMDLVVNHTAKDSPLIEQHPAWYVWEHGEVVSPYVLDPDDPSKRTVWGDLAEIDNECSPDRDALWEYWSELVRRALELGFEGFRCDAAYKVPSELWQHLIGVAREVRPDAAFFAETLGGPEEAVVSLRTAGFDYIFNSSKWWDFTQPWALEQHAKFRVIAPSIAFPESHDTPRLAAETVGSEPVQRQRYAFAAAFSAGLMMPVGYEFGFRKPLHVVDSRPSDWERAAFDLQPFIARVNALKRAHAILQDEGVLRAPGGTRGDVLVLERCTDQSSGSPRGWILVNKVTDAPREVELPAGAGEGDRLFRVCRDDASAAGEPLPRRLELGPAEVCFVLPVPR